MFRAVYIVLIFALSSTLYNGVLANENSKITLAWMKKAVKGQTKYRLAGIKSSKTIISLDNKPVHLYEVKYIEIGNIKCCIQVVIHDNGTKAKVDEGSLIGGADILPKDLDGKGATELLYLYSEMHSGYWIVIQQIGYINSKTLEFKAIYSLRTEDNSGAFDETSPEWKKEEVELTFIDLDGDGAKDVVENWTVTTIKGVRKFKKKLLFKDGRFVLVK